MLRGSQSAPTIEWGGQAGEVDRGGRSIKKKCRHPLIDLREEESPSCIKASFDWKHTINPVFKAICTTGKISYWFVSSLYS
jgi:hypothetical protein